MLKTLLVAATATITLALPAAAADLGRMKAPPAAPYAAPFSWTGFYAGVNIGSGVGVVEVASFFSQREQMSGVLGGAQLGVNYQFGHLVIGAEADLSTGLRRSTRFAKIQTGWDATARARVGFAMGRALLYATSGAAFTNLQLSSTPPDLNPDILLLAAPDGSDNWRQSRTGWVVGGGMEYAIADNITLRAEYLLSDYGRKFLPQRAGNTDADPVRVDLRTQKFRVGVNYLFSTGASVVMARY